MTKFNRFVDGVEFIPRDSDWTPHTTFQLLAKIGVTDASEQRQREAVAAWLVDNEPAPFLRMCLEDDGLLEYLDGVGGHRHSAA